MPMNITDLPTELVEEILIHCDPIEVAQTAQTCRSLRKVIYCAEDTKLWRELYLRQPFDDPRRCISYDGHPRSEPIPWKSELQRIIRTRTVVTHSDVYSILKPGELKEVLQTLIDLVCNVPRAREAFSTFAEISHNLVWAVAVMVGENFLDQVEQREASMDATEQELTARLHVYYGITSKDSSQESRVKSRSFVYSFRNYRPDNDYGPLHPDKTVNWKHMRALHHVVSMNLVDLTSDGAYRYTVFPLSLPFIQPIIPPDVVLEEETDWAGIAGSWSVSFCFCDHRDLLRFNEDNRTITDEDAMDNSMFEDGDFREEFRSLRVTLSVIGTTPDPEHPTRPIIDFGGEMVSPSTSTMRGQVKMTKDNQIHWRFSSGDQGNSIWSSEGIQIGGIRSSYGVLGSWTTVFHDEDDPVGPFWLHKNITETPFPQVLN